MATVQPVPGFAKAAATHPAPLGGSFFCSSWGAPLIKKKMPTLCMQASTRWHFLFYG